MVVVSGGVGFIRDTITPAGKCHKAERVTDPLRLRSLEASRLSG